MTRSTKPYGSWRSPITSDLVAAESIRLSDILLDGDDIYWNEIPAERGWALRPRPAQPRCVGHICGVTCDISSVLIRLYGVRRVAVDEEVPTWIVR